MDGRIMFKWIVLLDVVEWIYLLRVGSSGGCDEQTSVCVCGGGGFLDWKDDSYFSSRS